MSIVRRIENKARSVLYNLSGKLNIPVVNHAKKWNKNLSKEVDFWDNYIKTKGHYWKDEYEERLNPDQILQDNIGELLSPAHKTVKILDVGAGPITSVGKKYKDYEIEVTAVDPLAEEYEKLIVKYGVQLPVKTQKADAEKLYEVFEENSFDIAYARNCLDHSYSPETAITQMIHVVKRGSFVLLEHEADEAVKQNYRGLHQWNFSCVNGDFIISSANGKINFTKKYANICETTCIYEREREWITTKIRKL